MKSFKKLSLNKETLLRLQAQQMQTAIGGMGGEISCKTNYGTFGLEEATIYRPEPVNDSCCKRSCY
ncbi:MAG: class I lanthipeptide [Saprospiraceae bacterium]